VKPVFLLGGYGCIFYGTGNSAQLCQNFGISGEGLNPPLGTPLSAFVFLDRSTHKMKSLLSFETTGALCLMTQIASQIFQEVGVVGMVVITLQFDSPWFL
jgi:hypothetical protein